MVSAVRWRRRLLWLGLGVLATCLAGIVLLNLWPHTRGLQQRIGHVSAVESVQFRREMGALLGTGVSTGNAVQDFQNGAEIFPAMLASIHAARHSINLETYIYWSGNVSKEFVAALTERARAGVKVRVLADWVGSTRMKQEVVDALRAGGVRFEYFHPLSWYAIDRVNNRTHRKLMVVDGKVAFNGGVGIADAWDGDGTQPDHWRDMQFRVEGPAAAQMQAIFGSNWLATTGEVLLGPDYYPDIPAGGDLDVQAYASSPQGGSQNMQLMYLMAINGARRSIDLECAYFVPDELTLTALRDALARGVRVRLVVPGPHVDSAVVRDASQAQWGAMLQAGARMYRYQPSLFHNKLMVVDGYLTIAGSANFDNRSFQLNDESNIAIYDHAFAAHMIDVIEQDLARSQELTLPQWRARPWRQRASDWLSSTMSAQL
ncbi:phospholipase D-like domain-containing protein [Rhodanobacter spathiphylli]|uniref:Cardiolipin synthase n=1 Tax=Rhodanobacter spathiphylli B39 TaxID=1163407 RepID=I4VVP4_9GAMM|nr:phospholipase D-like domain-containing protein [Rhodanobacter spathiphylli]EIL91285.1 cardiolipin synthase [Rhodanobacter spathiphylli B39]